VIVLLVLSSGIPAQKIKEKDLPPRYQQFMDYTRYIMLEQERDVFLQLTNDRDRAAFVKIFWKQRDPTPGTPTNEFKDEHEARWKYANSRLGRSTPREGWRTDQGRIHIIMGEPSSIERFDDSISLYPVQVWYYYGDVSKGQPTHFGIVFFQRHGVGEWRLYDHVADGPAALLRDGVHYDATDYEGLYEKIYEASPTLSLVALSMVPGEIPFNYQPSPINNIYMASVFESRKKDINPTYATHFLDYKGMVTADYMTNYIPSEGQMALIPDPVSGIDFLHFSIAPKEISVDYYDPTQQYFCNFTVNASLRVDDENIIFQYTKEFPFYFKEEDLPRVENHGIAVEDSFPAISGRYKFIVLLQNSIGKEFTLFEREIDIPARTDIPSVRGVFLGYKKDSYTTDMHIPFMVLDKKLVVDPKNTFGTQENVSVSMVLTSLDRAFWETGKVRLEIQGTKPTEEARKVLDVPLRDQVYSENLHLLHTLPAESLAPDYYEMKVHLLDGNDEAMDSAKATFIISAQPAVSHPLTHAKAFPMANSFLYHYAQASQYAKINELEKAEASYAQAFRMKPDYKRGLVEYSNFLYRVKKYDEILQLIEPIQDDENLRFEYFLLGGKAFMGKGQYDEAIASFQEANQIYDSDISLLNSLGFCYYRLGDKDKALQALRASLRLNGGQDEVKKLIAEIEKK
jgi:GWxTD domain-containing protein